MMKKITILSLHLSFGGVEKCIASLANMLENDFEIEIISLYKMLDKPAFPISEKITIKYLTNLKPNRQEFKNALKEKNIFKIIKETFKAIKILYLKKYFIRKSIKNSSSDIIISTRIDFSSALAKSKRKDIIKIVHEHVYHNNNKKYINKLKNIVKKVNYIMPSSQYLTDFYKKEFTDNKNKIIYLKWPIEELDKNISTLTSKNIVSTGRLAPEKGFSELIDIFKVIQEKYPDWNLTIIGDGVLKQELQKHIKNLNLENKIKLLGFLTLDQIKKEYLNCSIYVMTSFEESFGLVLLEAGSTGLPLVAFDQALGAKEIIGNNEYGILVQNRNKEEMIKKISNLIDKETDRKKFGQKSYKRASQYAIDKVKQDHLLFYRNL